MDPQELLNAISDSAILLDKTGRIIKWNHGATNLFGYHKDEVIGRSVNCIYDRNYPFPKLIQENQLDTSAWQEITTVVKKNGEHRACRSMLKSLSNNESNRAIALLTHQLIEEDEKANIIARLESQLYNQTKDTLAAYLASGNLAAYSIQSLQEAERKLRESELSFHLLAENATDIISRHSPNGAYLYISPACKQAISYEPEDLLGKSIYKYIYHEDLSKVKKAFNRKRETPSNKAVIYRFKRKEGEFRWFESNIRILTHDKTNQIYEIQLASRDITDRVLDKKARLRGQKLAHVFRLSTMEEMASGMAHEISQPLTAIINYTRGCVRQLTNPKFDAEQLRIIMEKAVAQAERAGEIIQRLKNFFCKGQLIKTPCKLSNVIRETISFIKHDFTATKTKIELDFEKLNTPIVIDKIQIQQVILNLLQNSQESMHLKHVKNKHIYVETKIIDDKAVAVTIRDTGPGFSKENISQVFMPFYTTKTHGRGMGLAICRSIIEAHGGEFTINPNQTGDSWIRFTLPLSI